MDDHDHDSSIREEILEGELKVLTTNCVAL